MFDPSLKRLYMYRYLYRHDGTFSTLCDDFPLAQIVEPPWLLNKKNESCIPAGTYLCELQTHFDTNGKGYPAYEIKDPTGHRTDVEIHIGNDPLVDSKGCPLIGMQNGKTQYGNYGVAQSKVGYDKFMLHMTKHRQFVLVIKDCIGYERKTIRRNATPRINSKYIPEGVMATMNKRSDLPKLKTGLLDRIAYYFWRIKPVIEVALNYGGKALTIFNPAVGLIVTGAGKALDKIKGHEEVERETSVKAWETIIRAIISLLENMKKKADKKDKE